jgi:hypothetical protein
MRHQVKGRVTMKSQALRKTLTVGAMAMLLSASIAVAGEDAPQARTDRAAAHPAPRSQIARKNVSFQTERTDSWLCNHVSVFFCSNLFPTLGSSPTTNAPAASALVVPDRSRHD